MNSEGRENTVESEVSPGSDYVRGQLDATTDVDTHPEPAKIAKATEPMAVVPDVVTAVVPDIRTAAQLTIGESRDGGKGCEKVSSSGTPKSPIARFLYF